VIKYVIVCSGGGVKMMVPSSLAEQLSISAVWNVSAANL
jgi:hypothetical protein